ncbi:uncharacterized protein LOC125178404 [Hyalella azteca]|uniref:Uncharacterized protein LOC125178404 n=1 Tax=Hyalella azteca TaxID=294128 RepID=A0A979FLV2_HYAAZ|nr:uncharacterized protein LOC125178404 [Hyalella azteca]
MIVTQNGEANELIEPLKSAANSSLEPLKSAANLSLELLKSAANSSLEPLMSAANSSPEPLMSAANSSLEPVKSAANSSLEPIKSASKLSLEPVKSTAKSSLEPVKSAVNSSRDDEIKATYDANSLETANEISKNQYQNASEKFEIVDVIDFKFNTCDEIASVTHFTSNGGNETVTDPANLQSGLRNHVDKTAAIKEKSSENLIMSHDLEEIGSASNFPLPFIDNLDDFSALRRKEINGRCSLSSRLRTAYLTQDRPVVEDRLSDCECVARFVVDFMTAHEWDSIVIVTHELEQGVLSPDCLRGPRGGLLRLLWGRGWRATLVSSDRVLTQLYPPDVSGRRNFLLADTNASRHLMQEASAQNALSYTSWAVIAEPSSVLDLAQFAGGLEAYIPSEIYLLGYNHCSVHVLSAYRIGPRVSEVQVEEGGTWTAGEGFMKYKFIEDKIERRQDFKGYPIIGVGVRVFDFFTTYLPDGGVSGFVGDIVTTLKNTHNFSLSLSILKGYSYGKPIDGANNWDGMVGELQNMLVFTAYTATLTSYLAVVFPATLPFSNLFELSKHSEWGAGCVKDDLFQVTASKTCAAEPRSDECQTLYDVWNKNVMKESSNLVATYTEGLLKAIEGQYVFIGVGVTTQYYMRQLPAYQACKIKELSGMYIQGGIAIGLQYDSPFQPSFDLSLQKFRELGLMHKFVKKWMSVDVFCEDDSIVAGDLIDVSSLFVLLLFGLGLSIIIFVVEIMKRKSHRRRQNKKLIEGNRLIQPHVMSSEHWHKSSITSQGT